MILQIPLGETFSGVFLIITKKCKNLKHIKNKMLKSVLRYQDVDMKAVNWKRHFAEMFLIKKYVLNDNYPTYNLTKRN